MIYGNRAVTYEHLAGVAHQVEARMIEGGLRPGAVACLLFNDQIKHLATFLACLRMGVVALPVNKGHIAFARALSPDFFISDAEGHDGSKTNWIKVPDAWITPSPAWREGTPSRGQSTETMAIWFSSGTTGEPKAIATSWQAFNNDIQNRQLIEARSKYARACVLPALGSRLGMTEAFCFLSVGTTLVLLKEHNDIIAACELFGVDFLSLSTFQLMQLVDLLRQSRVQLSTVKGAWVGGGMASPILLRDAMCLITGNIIFAYGATEAGSIAFTQARRAMLSEGLVGEIVPWAKVEIIGDDGRVLQIGEEGSVRLSTCAMSFPYAAEAKNSPPKADWFMSGDRGRRTGNGDLFITGRMSDLINVGGVKIAPEPIEALIRGIAGVRDVAAVGLLRPGRPIEELTLFLVPDPHVDRQALVQACVKAEPRLLPAHVHFINEMPRAENGKVSRARLKQQIKERT